MSIRKGKGLLQYWSIRYFLVVVISMGAVMAATLYFVQNANMERQYRGLEGLVNQIAQDVVSHGGTLPEGASLSDYLIRRSDEAGLYHNRPVMFLLDPNGNVMQQYPPVPPPESTPLFEKLPDLMNGESQMIMMDPLPNRQPHLVAVHPIGEAPVTGYVVYMMPRENLLSGLIEFRLMRVLSVATLITVGLVMIFLMTRGLLKPIRKTVDAARQIVAGNYQIHLDNQHHNIKELHELMLAMNEMADRLHRLEKLRAQLLAGVTHELKTPITSISGLIQAVRDEVVDKKESKIFLDNAINQTQRLHKMVEDLLDFNSFATNTLAIRKHWFDLKSLINGTIERWKYSLETGCPKVSVIMSADEPSWQLLSDPDRIEQIIMNLLNNALDAMIDGGEIRIMLTAAEEGYRIDVQDTGHGIPAEHQDDVFVPFYRGENKIRRVHGLGLGLPFSRLIARSLGGDLVLRASSPEGTTFTLTIPRQR